MNMISKEEASCIFFCKKYSEENSMSCLNKIERMEDIELCYSTNSRRPSVQSEATIYGNLEEYHTYSTKEELKRKNAISDYEKEGGITFETKAQLLEFVNYVYQPNDESDPKKPDYIQKNILIKDIFRVIIRYSEEFKSVDSFTTWCSKSKSNFISVKPFRKVVKIEKDQIAKKISSTLEDHKTYMMLKNEGFHIIGYCRKSDLKKEEKNLGNLLQQMVENLYKRSLVDSVFVSPYCNANVPFSKRDLNGKTMIFSTLQNIHGDPKDKKKICIVCLDYAGLTTNILDLKHVLQNNENIKKIVVDMYFSENHFHKLDANDLLDDKELINVFDCRTY
ncbi:hypothetical protein F4703DRAFT_1781198 [Phycomyces blakesleeanus]